MGAPTKKDMELINAIGLRLGQGEPLSAICRDVKICDDSVRNWMRDDEEVFRVIARARAEGEETIAFNLRETARGRGESSLDVQRDKLIIDTDLRLLAKWNPKRYGDKLELAGDAERPLTVAIDVAPKVTKDEWMIAHGLVATARATK